MMVKIRFNKELWVFSHNQQTVVILEVNVTVLGHSLNLLLPTNCPHLPENLPVPSHLFSLIFLPFWTFLCFSPLPWPQMLLTKLKSNIETCALSLVRGKQRVFLVHHPLYILKKYWTVPTSPIQEICSTDTLLPGCRVLLWNHCSLRMKQKREAESSRELKWEKQWE